MCSDGLTGMVADDKIERVVSNQRNLHLQDRANKLVMIANEAGGVDNISVELVEFADIPGAKRNISSRKAKILAIASGVALSILAIFAILHFFRKDKPIDDTSTNADITSPTDSIGEVAPPLVEASTTNGDSDFIREESIDLGPIKVSKNESFLTIRFKPDGSTIESTTTHVKIDKDLVSNPDIIDIKDGRLIREIAHKGKDSILKIKIKNAPNDPQSFSIVIPDKNGKYKLTLTFQLSLKTTPPPKKPTEEKTPADSTQTPQVEQPAKTIPADSTTHSNKEEPVGKNTLNRN